MTQILLLLRFQTPDTGFEQDAGKSTRSDARTFNSSIRARLASSRGSPSLNTHFENTSGLQSFPLCQALGSAH